MNSCSKSFYILDKAVFSSAVLVGGFGINQSIQSIYLTNCAQNTSKWNKKMYLKYYQRFSIAW